jgi:signal transduction histidine kinase
MSHELRTPLNSILILSELLKENNLGNLTGPQIDNLSVINSSGKDLLNLITDILDISKIEAGKVEFILRNPL